MSLEQQQKDLEAYVNWKAEKEVTGNDVTPAAYVIDKAKQAAFERVEAAIVYYYETPLEDRTEAAIGMFKILNGDD